MKNKKMTIIVIALVFLAIGGATYGLWRWTSSNNINIATLTNGIYVYFNGGRDITGRELIPTATKEEGIVKKITAQMATENYTSTMNLYLKVNTLDSGLKDDDFKWALYKDTTLVNSGNFLNASANQVITLASNQTVTTTISTYYLYIWIDGTVENSSNVLGQNFSFTLYAEGTGAMLRGIETVLPDFITDNGVLDNINSTYVQNQTPGIDFTQVASDTNGKGLYIRSGTEDDENPIYYYRGDVDDNNVYFANYCWKIVRTTETGGLKLVYNGEPTATSPATCDDNYEYVYEEPGFTGLTPEDEKNVKVLPLNNISNKSNVLRLSTSQTNAILGYSAFNNDYDDAKYVGYMYYDSGTLTSSTIKTYIDDWYEDNMLTYASYLEDTVWCNDRTIDNELTASDRVEYGDENLIEYMPYSRYLSGTPSLTCTNTTDAFTVSDTTNGNGNLTYPIALLTMDEIWLAGVDNQYNGNYTYYLNNGYWWWSLSPYSFFDGYAFVWFADPDGGLDVDDVDGERGVRVAISLRPGLTFDYGIGTGANPYRFVETITPGSGVNPGEGAPK